MTEQLIAHPQPTAEESSQLAAQNILVTGGTGLVGSHLIQQLIKQGRQVTALYRGEIPTSLKHENLHWVKGDVLDVISLEQSIQNIEHVYHCAAIVSFNPRTKMDMFKTNVEGTANVVNAALNAGVKKLCFVSSVAALGRLRTGQDVNETMNWTKETSNSNYGKSKYLAELEVWRGIGEGLPAVIVNPVIILGAADWTKGSAAIFKSAYDEFAWYTLGASGFVDVHDVINATIPLTDSNISGQRFIISAENRTFKNIFTLMANGFGKKPPHKKATAFMSGIVWRLEAIKAKFNGKSPLLTKETAATAQATVRFENSKLLKFLPAFKYTPLEQTITRVCNEMKEKYAL